MIEVKKQVQDFVESLNHTTSYSGKKRTMFIHGEDPGAVELQVWRKFVIKERGLIKTSSLDFDVIAQPGYQKSIRAKRTKAQHHASHN